MKKTIATISSMALCLSALSAQEQYKNEFTVHAGIGVSTFITFSSPLLAADNEHAGAGFGGNFGADYTHFFLPNFGVSAGIEAALHTRSMALSNLVEKQQVDAPGLSGDADDTDSGNFFLYTLYEGLKEDRLAALLQFPVMLHYQIPLTKYNQCTTHDKDFFYVAAGAKVAIPLMASYTQTVASKTLVSYTGRYEVFFNDDPRITDIPKTTVDVTLKSSYIIPALELGYKAKLKAENSSLYIGLELDVVHKAGIKVGYAFGSGRKH